MQWVSTRRNYEQENVPAEQPPSCKGSWVPCAHAHPRGPRHCVGSPPQGPYRAFCVADGNTPTVLDKAHRITSAADYKHVVRRGRRSAGGSTVTYTTKNPNGGEPRFGFIVAKTVGNAVARNRVRRRLKALSYAALQGEFVPRNSLFGCDLVFRALPSSASASFSDLRDDVERAVSLAASR